jgi:hypothetical protein
MFIELFFIFSVRRKAFEFECKQNKHSLGYLGKSILLFIWISLSRIYHNHKYVIKIQSKSIPIFSRLVSCSQISIVITYFQLCGEDYHWWWRSFIASGGSAFYVFAYSIFYFFSKVKISQKRKPRDLLYFFSSLILLNSFHHCFILAIQF